MTPKEHARYVWDECARGIWDNERKCWVVWQGSGGGWYSTAEFQSALMQAINEHPATVGYRRNAKAKR